MESRAWATAKGRPPGFALSITHNSGLPVSVLTEQMAVGSGRSIPLACQDWAATKAAYRFFPNERICEEQILATISLTEARSTPDSVFLVLEIEDTLASSPRLSSNLP
jgi:hypothetical protein